MPPATVFQVDTEGGERKPVSSYSYKTGESFADARVKLEAQFDFAFQFIDVNLATRMLESWEKYNLLEDWGGKIVIIPKSSLEPPTGSLQFGARSSQQVLGSSNASNGPSLTGSVDWSNPPLTEDVPVDDAPSSPCPSQAGLQETELQVTFTSTLMSNALKAVWEASTDKLRTHMESIKCADHKWKVKTWDKDNMPWGHIECCECDKRVEGLTKGTLMDKTSINNAFTNFKNSHLRSAKHAARVARNRGEKVGPEEIARRAQANTLSDRSILDEHLKIVAKINESQTVGRETFTVEGDVSKEPVDLKTLKLFCNFCLHHLTLVPKQRNLEANLSSHCTGLIHLDYVAKSQRPTRNEPVLSGRPGRPRTVDGRDMKQRKIGGFLTRTSTTGASSSSSRLSGRDDDRGTFDNLSLLCWGLWRDEVKVGLECRPIKSHLHDQVKVGGTWYAEPLVMEEVVCLASGETCQIEGLFRHKECSRMSTLGGGFDDLTCSKCFSIQTRKDFRLRVAREFKATEKRGDRGTGKGRRLDCLTIPEVQNQAKFYRNRILRERKLQKYLSHKLLMLKSRVPSIREVCLDYQGPSKASILKCCQSIVLAHRNGAFGGRGALWDMLSDIASNLNRTKQGYRYKAGTKLLMQTIFLHGGRRVVDCLASNGIGPSLNTLQWDRRGMAVFRAGIHAEQFVFIAKVYSLLKTRLNISGPIPCYLAEDETCVKRTVRYLTQENPSHLIWMPKHDTIIGFCGSKVDHICQVGWEIEVGEAEVGFNNIVEAFDHNVVGHQARCVIVNPLVEGFPRLCILATATCNKFDVAWVRCQWEILETMWATHCLESVGPLLGHASDGDARRRKLMLEDYTGRGMAGPRSQLRWEGWLLTHSLIIDGPLIHAVGLHDQDYIHNGKKLVNPLDSTARILKLGTEVANLSHLIHLYDLYDTKDHGLNSDNTKRTDRQNWASAQRLCSHKVGSTLKMLHMRKDARVELTLGTEVYIRICADYLDIFMNTRITLRERIVLCGKVGFFFRLWRLWCFHGNHAVGGNTQLITFTRNCIPMQTFLDIQMTVHFVVLLIIQFREHFKHLPVPLELTGSDACEQFFSKVGGMHGHERSYDLAELVECATNLNRLAAMDLAEGMMGAGKSHKKHANIWMHLQSDLQGEHSNADQTDYTGIETDAEVIVALQEGLKLAQDAATELQMNPSTSCKEKAWWNSPWKVEAKGVKSGGWCDINVDSLVDVQDTLDGESPTLEPATATEASTDVVLTEEVSLERDGRDVDPDVEVAGSELEATMDILHSDLLYGASIQEVKPTVSFQDRHIYKSTLVSQLVGNPHLSKDRLTRVKQSIYFNNLVDRPIHREGVPTMFMTVGSDCGVFFLDETVEVRTTRNSEVVSKASKAKGLRGKSKENVTNPKKDPKRPRGDPVPVCSASGPKYVWWIGRVQSIHRKYGNSVGRSREALDLLDRPGPEAACQVVFNWFTPIGRGRHKFAYTLCDPQSIDLDCVISTVNFTVDPLYPTIFNLHPDDVIALDNFVKNHIV